jgi:hypothetical protein
MAQPAASLKTELRADAVLPAGPVVGRAANATPPPADAPWLGIEAHDRQQIELQLTHGLTQHKAPIDVELFMFIPRNVGVTSANYPRDEFYGDLTAFVRVDLPDVTLGQLADPLAPASPLSVLLKHLDAYARTEQSRPLAVQVKLFGHAFTEAVKDRRALLRAAMARATVAPPAHRWALLDDLEHFAQDARAALGALRRAEHKFAPLGHAAPHMLAVFQHTDEYCSVYLDGALALLAQEAAGTAALYDGSGFVGRVRQVLARHAAAEASYRSASGYLNLRAGEQEYFAYRQSYLKKAVQQALYVDTRRLPTDTFVRNATGAVAAGLAATWALVAQIPTQVQGLPPGLQAALFALPVVAYMGKDRIKELSREWLLRRMKAYDVDTGIRAGNLSDAGLGALAGRLQERVQFFDAQEVPAEVLQARLTNRTVRQAEAFQENVLVYSRRLALEAAQDTERPPEGLTLRQIVRLNLRHFLTRLDEPQQAEAHFLAAEGRFAGVTLPKVYHLNVVARLKQGGVVKAVERARVVLNKEGIVRLEHVPL